jgi:hypothetical protein
MTTDKLAALDAKAKAAYDAAMAAADRPQYASELAAAKAANAVAHDRLAHALVNAYRAGDLVPRAELEEAVGHVRRFIIMGSEIGWNGFDDWLAEARAFLARHTQEAERG